MTTFSLRFSSVRFRVALFSAVLSIGAAACGNKKEEAAPAAAAPAAAKTTPTTAAKPATPKVDPAAAEKEAKAIFAGRCVACHGATGKGDGVGAAALNPKPRNYTDTTWQASVSDEDIAKTIVGGGMAVGKSPVMPPNPDLKHKPEVVKALVGIIRDFEE